jgi:hypothetical protein
MKIGGGVVYVEYGQTLGEAIAGKPADERMPGEEPLPQPYLPDGEPVIAHKPKSKP